MVYVVVAVGVVYNKWWWYQIELLVVVTVIGLVAITDR